MWIGADFISVAQIEIGRIVEGTAAQKRSLLSKFTNNRKTGDYHCHR